MVVSKFFVRRNFSLRNVGKKMVQFWMSSHSKDYVRALESRQKEGSNIRKGLSTDVEEVFLPMRKAIQMEGKVALIMGGTTEIGVLCVTEMLLAGVGAVMIADEDEQKGRQVVIDLSDEYGTEKTAFIRTDFRCDDLLKNAFQRTLEHFHKIDVLVNIANSVEGNDWKTEIDKNVKGIVQCTLLGYKYMDAARGGGGGSVLNMICDRKNILPTPYFEGCRHYLIAFGKSMSQQNHTDTGVKVVTLFVDVDRLKNEKPCPTDKGKKTIECDIPNIIRLASTGSIWTT